MKSPRLLRPMFVLGLLVILIALILFLLNPGIQNSVAGILGLILAFALGGYAIVRDMIQMLHEVREMEAASKKKPEE